ncbi:MAG TPA: HAMP domain-containing sensor histidine kinase [Candidatus Dormibacteraeota bacterium]|nr:HAMP domain-containing sensor histidine kinase [Candidatus Dormibacteraeota bacterium]
MSSQRPPWGGGGRRPPWWPEDAEWPQRSRDEWRRHGRMFARRAGCAIGVLLLVLIGGATALVWLLLSAVGVINSAPFSIAVAAIAVLFAAMAASLAILAVRRLGAPIRRLVEAARRVEGGDYSARVPVRGPAEMRSLARAFNEMSGRLEAEDTRRRSVLADVAHELRTPLTVIRSHAEAIGDGIYPADAEHLAPIITATQNMEVLIEDLRTLTLAEAGALRLRRESVDVAVLVNETVDAFSAEAAEGGVKLVAAADPATPSAEADPARLRGVLGNLIRNALAHTPHGGSVRVEAEPAADGVEITVRDSGAGVPPDLLPRMFDRFVKGTASQGSGLGLAIVRDVVEAHGGTVSAESQVGQGTAVHVTLPGSA